MFKKFAVSLVTAVCFAVTAWLSAPAQPVFANEFDSRDINAQLNATAQPDHIVLTWSDDPATTMTVSWRTDTTVKTCRLEYRAENGSPKVVSVDARLFQTAAADSASGEMNQYTMQLAGLKPGTKYLYRIGNDRGEWTDVHTFTTESAKTLSSNQFKFLVFGDSQSGNAAVPDYAPWHDTVQHAYAANRDAAFFINMGDLVERGQSYQHWSNWFNAVRGVIDAIPEMPVQGNHETYNATNGNSTKPDYFVRQFPVFSNGPAGLIGQTYSFNYGKVHLVVLDSQGEEESQDETGTVNADRQRALLNEQAEWLAGDLARNRDAAFTLVFFHKTPYYNKGNRTNVMIKDVFSPVFDRYHVDLVFNGHDHGISRTYPMYGDQWVQNPDQGTVYYVTGRSGAKYYPDLTAKVWDAFFYDPQDQPNYQTVELDGKRLTVKAWKQDGTLVDTYMIDKSRPGNNTSSHDILPPRYNLKQDHPAVGESVKLILFGNMANGSSAKATVINGKAYADIRTIASYAEGNYNPESKTLIVKNVKYVFTDDMLADKGTKVSIDALNDMGWNNHYDSVYNMVFVEK